MKPTYDELVTHFVAAMELIMSATDDEFSDPAQQELIHQLFNFDTRLMDAIAKEPHHA
jgi:hypothetical protein